MLSRAFSDPMTTLDSGSSAMVMGSPVISCSQVQAFAALVLGQEQGFQVFGAVRRYQIRHEVSLFRVTPAAARPGGPGVFCYG